MSIFLGKKEPAIQLNSACSFGWAGSLLVREEVLLAGLCERKILFRLKIYYHLRQAMAKQTCFFRRTGFFLLPGWFVSQPWMTRVATYVRPVDNDRCDHRCETGVLYVAAELSCAVCRVNTRSKRNQQTVRSIGRWGPHPYVWSLNGAVARRKLASCVYQLGRHALDAPCHAQSRIS